jgi:tetratricopeptide (TPR) repeat protein
LLRGRLVAARDGAQKGIPLLERSWKLAGTLGSDVPSELASRIGYTLAEAYLFAMAYEKAYDIAVQVVQQVQKAYGPKTWRSCASQLLQVRIMAEQLRIAEGEPILNSATACVEEALGADHPNVAGNHRARAEFYKRAGRYAASAEAYGRAGAMFSKQRGPTSPLAISMFAEQALQLRIAGDPKSCERVVDHTVAAAQMMPASTDAIAQTLRYELAGCRLDQGRIEGVADLLARVDADALQKDDAGYPWAALVGYERGRMLLARGDGAGGLRELRASAAAMASWRPLQGQYRPDIETALRRAQAH